ncbi:MAG: S8 family serine peptidase [Pseudomonadota bacterium]
MKNIVALMATLAIGLSACTSPLVMQPKTMVMGLDATTTGKHIDDQRNMVIITMTEESHDQLTQGQSITGEGNLPASYANFLARLSRDYGLSRVADWPLDAIAIHCLVFESEVTPSENVLNRIRQEAWVETAQALNYFSVTGEYDDPYYQMQPGHHMLQVAESHNWATGKGVKIAVIDTGVDVAHPDLDGRLAGVRNFVDRSMDVFKRDVHGTAVAGVIAAQPNNGVGMVGIAPEADVYGLKACRQVGTGSEARCSSFTLAKALNFAISERMDVINLSLTGPKDDLLQRLVQKAIEQGMLVVGAVGQRAGDYFPSQVDGVIGVASSANADAIVAPGNRILTTVPGDGYDFFSGSSFSAAHVSGVAALIRQRKPHLSSSVIEQLLAGTANASSGYANACSALARVIGSDCPDVAEFTTDMATN